MSNFGLIHDIKLTKDHILVDDVVVVFVIVIDHTIVLFYCSYREQNNTTE